MKGELIAEALLGPKERDAIPIRGECGKLGKGDVERIVLATVALAGIMSVALLAPNALQMLDLFRKRRSHRRETYIRSVAERLQRRGYLRKVRRKSYYVYRLTQEGERYLAKERLRAAMKRKRPWDKKWRVVIFDVREHKRLVRERLREELRAFNFTLVQQSVWVHPYPCEDVIALVKAELKLGREVMYFEAVNMGNEAALKRKYNLP